MTANLPLCEKQSAVCGENTITRTAPEITDLSTICCSVSFTLEAEHPEWRTRTLHCSGFRRYGEQPLCPGDTPTHSKTCRMFSRLTDSGGFYSRVENAVGQAEYVVSTRSTAFRSRLEYVDGVFVRGATRGDGQVGEDVTRTSKPSRTSKKLENAPPHLIVRGGL